MNNQPDNPTEGETSLFKRWRKSILPVKPEDAASVKIMKHSAFYLFSVMVILISLAIAAAIMFVL